MTSSASPAAEVAAALVAMFRTDPAWSNTTNVGDVGGRLFPTWAPRTHIDDYRVWSRYALIPEISEVKEALPRLTIDVRWTPHGYEQEQVGTLHGPVVVYLHAIVGKAHEEYGDSLQAAAMLKVLSTPLSSARIIAAELVPQTEVLKERVALFDGAWEYMTTFRSTSVGVLL